MKSRVFIFGHNINSLARICSGFSVNGFLVDEFAGEFEQDLDLHKLFLSNRPDFVVFVADELEDQKTRNLLYNFKRTNHLLGLSFFVLSDRQTDSNLGLLNSNDFYFLKNTFDFEALLNRMIRIMENKNKYDFRRVAAFC